MEHRPKKSLGQNFLQSGAALSKIRDAAGLAGSDLVLEIGPGLGALTELLLKSAGKIVAVEKDDDLTEVLRRKFEHEISQGTFELINGDILEFDPETLRAQGPYKLVANIPYNITGAIIEKFLSAEYQPSRMVLLVQKEVAERIVAKDRKTGKDGKESILSNAVKVYGTPSYVGTVKAGSFVPAPSVDSAIILIDDVSRKNFQNKHEEEVFFQIMKAGFAHKRKTLAGNLKNVLEPAIVEAALKSAGVDKMARAEDIRTDGWLAMARLVYTETYQ